MEVTALCVRLLMLMQLFDHVQLNHTQEVSSAVIVPSTLQVFEYRSVFFNCQGFKATAGLTVMRKVKGKVGECISTWETATPNLCAIKPAYATDSGEYWCENRDKRSNTVNINITAGSVILESPILPVMEGDVVTLRCRSKMTSSAHIADFYKDDQPIGSGSTGEIIIPRISKANEGLYKCSISDFGESPESWLAVREPPKETETRPRPPSDHSCHVYLILRTVFTILMVVLLMMLVGLIHFGKLRVTPTYVCICKVCKGSCQSEQNKSEEDRE